MCIEELVVELVLKGTSTETMMDLELVHRVAIDPPHI